MRAKTFALVKEGMANGTHSAAVGGAQVAQVYEIPTKPHQKRAYGRSVRVEGGRNLEAADAARIVARVSLGKHSILFRLGNDPKERALVIEELAIMLKRGRSKGRGFSFSMIVCNLVAAVACDELCVDICPRCSNAGQIRLHADTEGRQPMSICPTCNGRKRRVYEEDERVRALAFEWAAPRGGSPEQIRECAKTLRAHKRLRDILFSIDIAKGILAESERVAVEETCNMLERW